jgi:vacuolar protein sorting-associated protein 45
MVLTQSQLLAKEVYLVDRLDNRNREKMKHLKCICLVRPGLESIQSLIEELRTPYYGEYYLCNIFRRILMIRLYKYFGQIIAGTFG